jgi:hypothetical protein
MEKRVVGAVEKDAALMQHDNARPRVAIATTPSFFMISNSVSGIIVTISYSSELR